MTVTAKAEKQYPFSEHIIHINSRPTQSHELVTWHFPNGQIVQLIMDSPEDAELYSMSPALVLPEEGDFGQFYTAREIELFLTRISSF